MSIKAKITLDNSELKHGLKDAENTAKSTMKNIKNTAEGVGGTMSKIGNAATSAANAIKGGFNGVASSLAKIGPLGAAVAGAIALIGTAVYGAFSMIGKLTTKLDGIAKAAKSVNMSATAFQSLQYASKHAGVQMDNVITMVSKLDYAMTKAVDGEKKYREAFYALGLSWRELEKLSPERMLMRVVDAYGKMRAQGKSAPKELYDIFGRRGINDLNKMADGGFSRLVAEAKVVGAVIDEDTLRKAEKLTDSAGDIKDRFTATVSNMKTMKKLFDDINKGAEKLAEEMGGEFGMVAYEFKDQWEGIGDVGNSIIHRQSNRLSDEQKRRILNALQEDAYRTSANSYSIVGALVGRGREVGENSKLSGDALDKKFNDVMKNVKLTETSKTFRNELFKVVSEVDSRFNAKDKKTWLQDIQQSGEEANIAAERIKDRLDEINAEMEASIDYYDRINTKAGRLVDADKEILKLEKQLKEVTGNKNASLDKEAKYRLKINASLANQKALQNEILNLSNVSSNAFKAFSIEMLTGFGAAKQTVDNLITSLQKMTGKDSQELITKMLGQVTPGLIYSNPEELRQQSVAAYHKAFKDLADLINSGELRAPIDDAVKDQMQQAMKTYQEYVDKFNKIAEKSGVSAFKMDNLNLDFVTDNPDRILDNYKKVEEASKRLQRRFEEIDKAYAEMIKKRDSGASLEDLLKPDMLPLAHSIPGAQSYIKTLETLIKSTLEKNGNDKEDPIIREAEAQIKLAKDSIKRIKEERASIVQALTTLSNGFTEGKTISEVMKTNQQNLDIVTDLRLAKMNKENEASKLEIQLLEAQRKKQQDLVDMLQMKVALQKEGVEATQKNISLYETQLKKQIELNKQKGSEKVKDNLQNRLEETRISLLEKMGQGKEANRLQFISQAEKIKGSELTSAETDMVTRFADLIKSINDINLPNQIDDIIHSNELAAKGGFASSVVVDKRDNTEKIFNTISKMKEQESDILGIIRDIHNNKL